MTKCAILPPRSSSPTSSSTSTDEIPRVEHTGGPRPSFSNVFAHQRAVVPAFQKLHAKDLIYPHRKA
ncbi:hypothetical protein LshimejAT787_1101470 [Lyophyllum shimeji]|uniref:Uncharacterized protein n=1 Tax=Lyophyllum shimeji TaxID=47721 RepID=A0A9P3URD9_LYOSH|nr:hypothetical protein LshimejAT787_1101470 [Lyophyllum shimeji]